MVNSKANPLALSLLSILTLAACTSEDAANKSVGGYVLGSYYQGATVCADTNGNGICDDANKTTTDSSGAYKLTVPKAGVDIVVETLGSTRYEPSDNSKTVVDSTTKAVFRLHKDMLNTTANVSSISTQISAEIDNNAASSTRVADAVTKVAALAGLTGADASMVLSDFNSMSNATNKGLIKAHSDKALAIVQAAVTNTAAGAKVNDTMKSLMTTPSTQKGTVQYTWTQIGADDTPFSKLDITGMSGTGSMTTYPATDGTATATTTLQTTGANLYAKGSMVARAIVVPDSAGAATCPKIAINGVLTDMTTRAPVVTGVTSNGPKYGSSAAVDFNVLTCESIIPTTATSVAINGSPLKILRSDSTVNRVVVVGDTGCRLKGPTAFVQAADGTVSGGDPLQDCSSEAAWPWAKIAKVAASFAPDLILHNGDIHYREGFPTGTEKRWGGAANAANGGTDRDNATIAAKFASAKIDDSITYGWRSWEEDFFKAAGPLLNVAPWAITRGNHELCDRAGQGWFRFLDPRKFPNSANLTNTATEPAYDSAQPAGRGYSVNKNCSQYIDPVAMTIGDLQLVLLDVGMMNSSPGKSSSLGSTILDHVRVARQLTQISALTDSSDTAKNTWIVAHKPFFAYSGGAAATGNAPASAGADTWQLQKAIASSTGKAESVDFGFGTLPSNTQMTHAGHIHGFQMISHPPASNLPMNILMGTTGDNLEGLIDANTGAAIAAAPAGNGITSGLWPWFDQVVGSATRTATKWYGNFASYLPVNFSSSPITGAGKKETAVMTEFSFLVIDRITGKKDWTIKVYDQDRKLLRSCTTSGKTATCDG